MSADRLLRSLPPAAAAAVKADPKLLRQLLAVYRQYPDGRGRGPEVTMPPARGSRKYPWGR